MLLNILQCTEQGIIQPWMSMMSKLRNPVLSQGSSDPAREAAFGSDLLPVWLWKCPCSRWQKQILGLIDAQGTFQPGAEVTSAINVGSGLAQGLLSLQKWHWSEMITTEMTAHTRRMFPTCRTVCPLDAFESLCCAGLLPDSCIHLELVLEGC